MFHRYHGIQFRDKAFLTNPSIQTGGAVKKKSRNRQGKKNLVPPSKSVSNINPLSEKCDKKKTTTNPPPPLTGGWIKSVSFLSFEQISNWLPSVCFFFSLSCRSICFCVTSTLTECLFSCRDGFRLPLSALQQCQELQVYFCLYKYIFRGRIQASEG